MSRLVLLRRISWTRLTGSVALSRHRGPSRKEPRRRGAARGGRGPPEKPPLPKRTGKEPGCGNGRFLNHHVGESWLGSLPTHRPMAQGQTHLPRRLARRGHRLTSCKPLITSRDNLSRLRLKQAARPPRAPLAGPEFSSVVGLYTAPFSIAQGRGTQRLQRWPRGLHRLQKPVGGAVTSWASAWISGRLRPAPPPLRPRPSPRPCPPLPARAFPTSSRA